MNAKHIAAIEIGSSRIKGIVATADTEGKLRTLAIEEVPSGDSVRYGRIQNAREAGDLINDILRRLENAPSIAPGHISTVFIADGGRSLRSASSEGSLTFGGEEEITHRTLERLQKEALFNLGTERDVLAIAPKRLFVDQAEVKKIVGTFGTSVRGEFTLITQASENRRALERVIIETRGENIQRDYVTRLLAQTEMALSDSDRQVGSLFIDFGAETTSMAAFREGSLVFAATLPIGGANITRDLSAALNVTFEKAESIKKTKGEAVVDRAKYEAPDEETREIVNYVSARAGEIIANVINILDGAGFSSTDFPGGAVITGGATMLKGFPEMVEQQIKLKVRTAGIDTKTVTSERGINIGEHFDAISLAKYAAAHSAEDCLVFPEKKEEPQKEESTTPRINELPPQWGRRNVAEDDRKLLEDDEPIEQPDNINIDDDDSGELPVQKETANDTRLSLLERIKNIGKKASDLMKPPVGYEDNGMDD